MVRLLFGLMWPFALPLSSLFGSSPRAAWANFFLVLTPFIMLFLRINIYKADLVPLGVNSPARQLKPTWIEMKSFNE